VRSRSVRGELRSSNATGFYEVLQAECAEAHAPRRLSPDPYTPEIDRSSLSRRVGGSLVQWAWIRTLP